jgi:hypothetical protein
VQRITGAFLLAVFAATQSGWVNYWHLQEHAAARPSAHTRMTVSVPWPVDPHDERTCPICMTLHMPLAAAGYVPLLICFGLIVAFLSLLPPRPIARQVFAWIESRGPPIG